ncbi:NAD(P)-binding domain [Phytophthora cactorum]|nr:NAD(P)-binding domain [Phytophthora cactorum]
MTTPNGKTIGICGATGAVGIEIISVLAAHKFPVKQLVLFASSRSAGKKVDTAFGEKAAKLDYVFLAVSGDFSLQYAKELAAVPNGPIPLVIPEINGHVLIQKDGKPQPKLIANPNCTTAIAAMALWPLHCEFGIKKLIVSTYQAASGAGAAGMEELADGAKAFLADEPVTYKVFSYPLPFNLIPHIDKFQENGYTKEEMKVTWETRKIFGEPNLAALSIETVKPVNIARAREILAKADGVDLVDEPEKLLYPMPKNATKKFNIEAGRLRKSLVFGDHGLELFVSGDQLLRGAALNAVLIAEFLENPRSTPQFTKKPTTCSLSKDQQQVVLGLVAGVAVSAASVLAYGLVKKN